MVLWIRFALASDRRTNDSRDWIDDLHVHAENEECNDIPAWERVNTPGSTGQSWRFAVVARRHGGFVLPTRWLILAYILFPTPNQPRSKDANTEIGGQI